MFLVVVFRAAPVVAVLLSVLAARTVPSTSFLFLVGGAPAGDGFLDLIHIAPDSESDSVTAGLALFAVLFTYGMHVAPATSRANRPSPARALRLTFGLAPRPIVNGLVRSRRLGAEPKPQSQLPLATGIVLYATCHLTHTNPYLAVFPAGAALARASSEAKASFEPLGEALVEPAGIAALVVFGALLTPPLFSDWSWDACAAVMPAIVLIRPASLLTSLSGSRVTRRSWWRPGSDRRASRRGRTVCRCRSPASRRPRRRSPSPRSASPSRASPTAAPTYRSLAPSRPMTPRASRPARTLVPTTRAPAAALLSSLPKTSQLPAHTLGGS